MDHVLFALEGYFYKDREILFIFPKFGFLLGSFGTAFGLLHKNQKKGKSCLGEGQKDFTFLTAVSGINNVRQGILYRKFCFSCLVN